MPARRVPSPWRSCLYKLARNLRFLRFLGWNTSGPHACHDHTDLTQAIAAVALSATTHSSVQRRRIRRIHTQWTAYSCSTALIRRERQTSARSYPFPRLSHIDREDSPKSPLPPPPQWISRLGDPVNTQPTAIHSARISVFSVQPLLQSTADPSAMHLAESPGRHIMGMPASWATMHPPSNSRLARYMPGAAPDSPSRNNHRSCTAPPARWKDCLGSAGVYGVIGDSPWHGSDFNSVPMYYMRQTPLSLLTPRSDATAHTSGHQGTSTRDSGKLVGQYVRRWSWLLGLWKSKGHAGNSSGLMVGAPPAGSCDWRPT
jgi:hypothetical protein